MLNLVKINKITNNLRANPLECILLFISLLIIYGALIYYFYALTWPSIILTFLLSAFSLKLLYKKMLVSMPPAQCEPVLNTTSNTDNKKYFKYWPYVLYLILWILSLYLLYISGSDRALVSPWQIVNPKFFLSYAFSTLSLIIILINKSSAKAVKLIFLSLHYFLNFGVAILVYKISYGFDPFIHQATMELIASQGMVEPKPFYYLGEYSLIVIIHKLSGLTIYSLNKFLVPILAAIFLPWAAYRLLYKNITASLDIPRPNIYLSVLFILALSFSPFIISTPQSLSYLFLIICLVLGLTKEKLYWPIILALATLAIHPLTGIPALSWVIILALFKYRFKIPPFYYKLLKISLFTLSALTLPLSLFISGANNLKNITWNINLLFEPFRNLFSGLSFAGQESLILNTIYLIFYNYKLWLIIIISASLIHYLRSGKKYFHSLLFINLALLIAYLLSSQIVFTDVIDYEQTNFASRIITLMVIFCLPLILTSLNNLIYLIIKETTAIKIIWLFIGTSLLVISLYLSYPRFDNYFNSRGYSTSANDIAAVNLIANTAERPYIVLANQAVSMAALKELGFNNYHESDQGKFFFYPVPTGGALYQYYLDMIYKKPDKETMARARDLVGVEESYFVINKYWHQSAKIINEAKLSATSWQVVNNDVFIFKYLPQ